MFVSVDGSGCILGEIMGQEEELSIPGSGRLLSLVT